MNFVGNTKAVNLLKNSLIKGRVNHAYIFSGPEKVGKFLLAKLFASGLIEGGEMNTIDDFNKDTLLDLVVLRPEILEKNNVSKQRDIAIESIRDAKLSLSLFPYHGKYKVLIIDDAHKMTISAQNGLLKLLEEPNQTSVIILVTHEVDRILPTILSRCQIVNFGLVSEKDMKDGFQGSEGFSVDCIGLSMGRPGLAMFLSKQEIEKDQRKSGLIEFSKLKNASLNEKFKLAEEFSKDIVKTIEKLNVWIWEMRKNSSLMNERDRSLVYGNIEKIQQSMTVLKKTNANTKLVLESLFMDL